MKKVRLIFVGIMLAIVCVGFTSCGHEADMDPVNTETVENGVLDIDVRGEDPEEGGEGDGSGSSKSDGV